MIETLCSLKIVLFFLISILILDEIFLAQQTVETANFYALRAHIVDQDISKVDDFFNTKILNFLIFTKSNHIRAVDRTKASYAILSKQD